MLNVLLVLLFFVSFVTAMLNGRMEDVGLSLLSAPEKAAELTFSVGCSLCLWNGIMSLAEKAGVLSFLSRLFSPLLKLLFPNLDKNSSAAQNVSANFAANLLGLGAAAAPAGIRAISQFQKESPTPHTATDASILLILLNTASLQLIPTTTAQLRLKAGSAAPMEILPAVWLSSILSVCCGIFAAKTMIRLCCQSPLLISSPDRRLS